MTRREAERVEAVFGAMTAARYFEVRYLLVVPAALELARRERPIEFRWRCLLCRQQLAAARVLAGLPLEGGRLVFGDRWFQTMVGRMRFERLHNAGLWIVTSGYTSLGKSGS